MARSATTENDIYSFIRTAGAAERVARYRQEAENFRQLAQAEKDGAFQETLLTIAREYDQLADTLIPSE